MVHCPKVADSVCGTELSAKTHLRRNDPNPNEFVRFHLYVYLSQSLFPFFYQIGTHFSFPFISG